MPIPPSDATLPRLLSLSVHEFRTPITVVAGYLRMLLKERGGPLSDQQRRLLEEAEKSCARLSALLVEMSDLANLEDGTAKFNRGAVDLRGVLNDAIASLPAAGEHPVDIQLTTSDGEASVQGDPVRLKAAFSSLMYAVRRELVRSNQLFVKEREGEFRGTAASWIAIGDAEHIGELETATSDSLTTFDEWRGGCGLSLAIARRVIDGHGGRIWSPSQPPVSEDRIAGAIVALPRS